MKKILQNSLITSLVLIALGIFMVLSPNTALTTIIKVFGIAIIVAGAITVLLYVANRGDSRNLTSLATGIILIVAGIVFLVNPAAIEKIFPTVVGILIIVNGILNLIASIKAKKAGSPAWIVGLILSILTIALGILILSQPLFLMNQIVRIVGIVLIVTGVSFLLAGA
ncbi:MAG: DUF308 domain-containing protein [Oscillospiraceae bacterium]|nr:DUF308 domain-containing protein [Oscillospiraceae bacterium]